MKPPSIDLAQHLSELELTVWRGTPIVVWKLYDVLTGHGWKVDTEESNLMAAMSRTWRDEGIKVWIRLEEFVTAPPGIDAAPLDAIRFYRFDPAEMPATTMYDKMYAPGDEKEDWYPSHREEWGWLVENGDPQWDTFAILHPITLGEVPKTILEEAWRQIEEALEFEA